MTAVASNAVNGGNAAVTSAAAVAVPSRGDRKRVTLIASVSLQIGADSGLTTGNGATLPANVPVTLETTAAIWAIVATTATLSYIEEFS